MYKITVSKKAGKKIQKYNKSDKQRIIRRIDILEQNPDLLKNNIIKLSGETNSYRIRIGKIRILYTLNEENREIFIYDIGYRREIYKK